MILLALGVNCHYVNTQVSSVKDMLGARINNVDEQLAVLHGDMKILKGDGGQFRSHMNDMIN